MTAHDKSRRRVARRASAIGLGVVMVGIAGTTLASGQANDTPEPIHACVSQGNLIGLGKGTIRIVADPGACNSNEDPLSWNQQGRQGPPGEARFYTVSVVFKVMAQHVGDGIARCEPGDRVTGGGFSTGTTAVIIARSDADYLSSAWTIAAFNNTQGDRDVRLTAYCTDVTL